jgi:hypothetical protein
MVVSLNCCGSREKLLLFISKVKEKKRKNERKHKEEFIRKLNLFLAIHGEKKNSDSGLRDEVFYFFFFLQLQPTLIVQGLPAIQRTFFFSFLFL